MENFQNFFLLSLVSVQLIYKNFLEKLEITFEIRNFLDSVGKDSMNVTKWLNGFLQSFAKSYGILIE